METLSEGKTAMKTISHYAGPSEAIAWTNEGSEKWSRNVPGIDGSLCATQKSGEAAILQLHDLEGNIIATAYLSESETKLRSTYNSTEFGVPQPSTTPPKYAWLGANGLFTETTMESGVATKGGASYIPQIASSIQTAPIVPPGAFPNGQPGTQYEGAEVSPIGLKIAEEKAAQTWQQTETERQKQKEKEAAETLQNCREEGGCGAASSGNEEEGGAEENITLDPTFTTEFAPHNLSQTNTSQYGVLSIQVKYLGGGKARLQWSYELSPGLQGRIAGVATESASIYQIDGGRINYSDYHPNMPMDYLFHSAPQVSTGINYQLAINFEIEGISSATGRGVTAVLYVRCNFIIR
jgi:hypothetical protein